MGVVGIHTREDIEKQGAAGACLRVREAGFRPSLNLPYALEGALTGVRWDELSPGATSQLLLELDAVEDFSKDGRQTAGPWASL